MPLINLQELESRFEKLQAEVQANQTKAKNNLASKDMEIVAKEAQLKVS